jgi:hypothetical protein
VGLLACLLAGVGQARAEPPGPSRTAGTTGEPPSDSASPRADRSRGGKSAPGAAQRAPRLSAEDAQLLRDLALLEQLELLRNLDLFEAADAKVAPSPPDR